MARKTRYLLSTGELKRKDNSLSFRNEKGNNYIPIETIRELFCMNEISINTKLLDFLGKSGVVVHFFNYYNYYSGTFYPKEYLLSGNMVVKQVQAYENRRLDIAKAIVRGIAMNIHETLYHYYRHDKRELRPYLDWLKNDVDRLLISTSGIKQILAVEGEIWQRFYGSFKYFLPENFIMNKRVKRPPDNPINALISYGNSILYAKTITEIYNTHLNPTISFLHEPSEGRFSVALDISEVFKPAIVYKTIFELANNKKIQVEKHFDKKVNYCLLNENGRAIFIKNLEERFENTFIHAKLRRKVSYRTAIKLDCYKLIKCIVEEKEFRPFSMKEMV